MCPGRRPGRGVVGGAARSGGAPDAAGRPVTRRALAALCAWRGKGGRGNQDVMGPAEEEDAERAVGSGHLAAKSESSPDNLPGENRSPQARAVPGRPPPGAPNPSAWVARG